MVTVTFSDPTTTTTPCLLGRETLIPSSVSSDEFTVLAPSRTASRPHHVACDSAGHSPIAELRGVDGPLSRLIQEGVQRSSRFQKQPRRLVCVWACRVNEFVKMLSDAYLLMYYFHNV